jgi:hypothetical protein
MNTIDPLGPILAQIRAQALAWRQRTPGVETASPEERARTSAGSAPDWLAQVARAVVAIRPDDPRRQRKAFRVYLEALLARECGIQLHEGAEFQALVDRVLESMEADSRLNEAVKHAGKLLIRSARG